MRRCSSQRLRKDGLDTSFSFYVVGDELEFNHNGECQYFHSTKTKTVDSTSVSVDFFISCFSLPHPDLSHSVKVFKLQTVSSVALSISATQKVFDAILNFVTCFQNFHPFPPQSRRSPTPNSFCSRIVSVVWAKFGWNYSTRLNL